MFGDLLFKKLDSVVSKIDAIDAGQDKMLDGVKKFEEVCEGATKKIDKVSEIISSSSEKAATDDTEPKVHKIDVTTSGIAEQPT